MYNKLNVKKILEKSMKNGTMFFFDTIGLAITCFSIYYLNNFYQELCPENSTPIGFWANQSGLTAECLPNGPL